MSIEQERNVAGADLTGYRVQAEDGRIGKVDRHTAEVDPSHLVVDTGPWIFGHEVLIPAGTVERIDPAHRTVWVNRTRQEIRNAPAFHTGRHTAGLHQTHRGGGGPLGDSF
ncbi:PRC-barrel domain-containing protein [Kitasatospora cheerisanensis]|uniref:PRC domain containing protein n=1 Tax=Kitasatospora cheerisanensis KCTC 2395 TaxID=1348663 RepID=A0A066Z2I0_9ACTN|nr:PRC-barrel domain-containing protein [Kitasatospora cheerisanensis]KDN87667.1 hypothetical protein KCH_05880 [Kitasatospora cheerisanensis KCTC 2395]